MILAFYARIFHYYIESTNGKFINDFNIENDDRLNLSIIMWVININNFIPETYSQCSFPTMCMNFNEM